MSTTPTIDVKKSDVAAFILYMALVVIFASIFGHWTEVSLNRDRIESRCLAYFRDTFQGYDNSIEVCRHFIDGKPIAPYQFGQESSYTSSK